MNFHCGNLANRRLRGGAGFQFPDTFGDLKKGVAKQTGLEGSWGKTSIRACSRAIRSSMASRSVALKKGFSDRRGA